MNQRIIVRYKTFIGRVARPDRTRHKHIEESITTLTNRPLTDLICEAMAKIVEGQTDFKTPDDLYVFTLQKERVPLTADGESLQVMVELDRSLTEVLYEARDELRSGIIARLLAWVQEQWCGDFESIVVDLRFVSSCGMSVLRDREQVYTAWGGDQNPPPFTKVQRPREN